MAPSVLFGLHWSLCAGYVVLMQPRRFEVFYDLTGLNGELSCVDAWIQVLQVERELWEDRSLLTSHDFYEHGFDVLCNVIKVYHHFID